MSGSRTSAVSRLAPALLLAALLLVPTARAQTAPGTVWAQGQNDHGQLGDGTTTVRGAPAQVGGLGDVAAISAGRYHSLALMADGTVWAWGDNSVGQLGAAAPDSCGDPPGDPCSRAPIQVGGLGD